MTATAIDYNATAETVRRLIAGNEDTQALLRGVLPTLGNLASLQADEAALRASIKGLKDEHARATHALDTLKVETAAWSDEFRKARDAKREQLDSLQSEIVNARRTLDTLKE